MKQSNASGWTKIFWLGFCGAVAILGVFRLYLQFSPVGAPPQNEPSVASVMRSQGGVRYRAATTLIWQEIGAGFPLQFGDALLLGPEAQAEVLWHTGEKVRLTGGTMFIVPHDPRALSVPPPLLDMPNARIRDVAGKQDH